MTFLDRYLGKYYDKIQHCLGSMLLILILSYFTTLWWTILGTFVCGIVKELIDCYAFHEYFEKGMPVYGYHWDWAHFDWNDILANSIGIALATGLILWRG